MIEYKIRVPTRDRHGELLSAELRGLWQNDSIALFCTLFGGCEVSSAQGNWIQKRCDGSARYHQERVRIISACGPSEGGNRLYLATLRQHCQSMAAALNQECVMLSTHSGCTAEFINSGGE